MSITTSSEKSLFEENTPPFLTVEIDDIPVAIFDVKFSTKKRMFKSNLIIDRIDYNFLSDKRPESKEIFEKHICNLLINILNEMHGNNGKYNI